MHNPNPDSNYDVFLSSKSGDTDEEPFTSHLYISLQKAGISVFRDDDSLLSGGEQISPSVVQVIQRSRIFVVVLSEGYAGSRRSLEVLEQIIECRRIAGQFLLPVFLGISSEDVLYQWGGFGNAFDDLTRRISDKDKVESWKLSFARICQIQSDIRVELRKDPSSSRSVDGNKRWWSDNEVEDVVERAKNLLDRTDLFVAEHLVGLALYAGLFPIPLLINQKPEGVLLLGITGMIGIGKTTLAKAIYNHNLGYFEGRSFLPNIREIWEQDKGHVYLQERLLSDVYKLPREKIESIEIGKKMLKEALSNKKILVVLDDVTKLEQLNALCGSREWFGPGSMIIITTRYRSLLTVHGVEHVHNMKEMSDLESCELFEKYVKEEIIRRQDFYQLSKNIVASNGGLPLALEVSGSKVFGSSSDSILDRLAESPDPLVLKVFKSYINNLHNIEKDIFLDIVCFLIGMDREKVIKTLAFGDFDEKGITALEDKWLVTFDRMNKLRVNVLLRDTGREIIREQVRENHESSMYDVFLSFRGEGSCATFTSHLCTHLANGNINFFKKDDDEIRRGDWISVSQLQAIRRSRVCVVILSKHYANTRWCLEEMEKIMECHKTIGQVVVPIFYGVDRFAVHNQTYEFGEAFQNLLKTISVESDKEERWRTALGEIGNIAAGIEIRADSRNEREDIKNVIEHVTHSLNIMFVVEHPVGLKARVQDVIELLNCKKSKDVLLLGIWGMGGSGKTTIAKAIYNRIGRTRKYEVRSLLQNISEDWKQDNGQLYLQEKLLSDINSGTKIKINDVESGKELLIERLRHERILLLLDDVDKLEQLNVLCASRQWFGSDSVIIITTRDKHLLDELGVDHVYRTKEMDESESAILFSWHAFKQPSPREYFEGLSRDAVAYCGGLPLALVELGCELFGKDESEWESLLGKYKRSPHPMIQDVLKSFDDLNGKEKDMFIDIALFFIGMNREEAIWRLNTFGGLDEKGISALEDRFLVTVDMKNKLRMHILLRNKGREIIREQMQVELGVWIYDVFVSFKGEECATFTSHLCTCLANAKINFIKDDDEIRRQDRISISLLQEIGRCRISIVILSRDYANSRWCLQELEKIMECHKTIGQVVVPVFYGVDPSTVRNQTGQFGEAFQDLLTTFSVKSDKENNWRTALRQIGSIAGIVITDSRKEGDENVKNVMEHVTHSIDMFVVEHPVGLKARVQELIRLLNCEVSKDVLLLGIWGLGGSGKTTLAKTIYNILSRNYEGRSFLQDISGIWKQDNGRECLQEKLLSDINTTANVKKDDMKPGKMILCERLCHERILLVLDDVDDLDQLNALCGSREWFGSDSIIIITTRDKRLLNEFGVDHAYRMKEMDESESAMLLSWHAFKQPSPREDFVGLCSDAVAYCGGLPLALVELGCELFEKDKSEWKSLLGRYKGSPLPMIQNVLKRSFDGLSDDRVKNVFLEIACFFVGLDQNEVIQKLNGFGDHLAATSVPVLVEQSLVIVDEMNRLRMHVLLQHMAREIFRQRSGMPSIYDVFFSFSTDTPSSFTSCLIGFLEKAGISVFKNDSLFTGGDHISPSLLQVIQRCRISVVVLSKGYTGSRRCLEMLEQIIECSRIAGQFILPVFFDISGNELLYQASGFGDAFGDLTKRISDKDKVESWKIALARMSRHHHTSHFWPINNIVERAKGLLDRTDLFVAEYPVGVESRVRDACQLLNVHQKDTDVLLLGMWGMAGIGKTAIAKAIYNEIGGNFEGRSFLPNIREVWEQDRRHVYLQELLLSDVYKLPIIKIDSIRIGKKILKNKLSHKRVLLVLDDVNKLEQLDALCGSREWFGPGSVIIITTRDRSLLRAFGVDHVYRIKEMNERESLQLINKWLPGSNKFLSNGRKQNLVASVGGLPLGLEVEVLASYTSDIFKEFPHTVVQKAIKTCINDLNETQKCIFFDIACFLNGMDHEEAMEALNAFKLASNGMRALEDRCFVTFDKKNRLKMHVILRDVGRKIIHEQTKLEPRSWIYDVFLSFRGEDTRKIFASHLHASLANAEIHVFKDDNELRRGDRISISLLQAIRRSKISVVVLSRHYADSRWCLQELEYIMECRRAIGQVVLPVFYDVDPSSVRNQTCMFGEAFQDLLKKFSVEKDKKKEKSWRTALRDIGSIAGIEIIKFRDNNEAINHIVKDISARLDKSTLFVAEHPVGLESRVQSVIKLLDYQESNDVQILGISGIGGVGKTTIAKAIYNKIRHDFDGSSFLLDIRDSWKEMTSRLHLQEQILFDVLKTTKRINDIESGKNLLKERLHHRRILLILDNVDESDQLEALCQSRDWFGSGSRIIITTRDEGLLRMLKVDHKCRMPEMDNHDSVEHFSWHAFKQASPKEDFAELSRDVVAYCQGLPLALEVIGSSLFDEDAKRWQYVLEKLKTIPNEKVQKKLRISYDGLGDYTKREIFLDIAFFFIGMDQNDVMHILDGYYPKIGIRDLIDRNLVSVDKNNKLRMHDLLRDMGRQIVCEESLKEPEKRSRLWLQNDVLEVLENHRADIDYFVEGLTLKLTGKNTRLKSEAFRKMRRLRLLQFADVQLDGDFVCHDSCKLRWLYWHGYPLDYLTNCNGGSLVALELESSNLVLMSNKTKILEKLKVLNLSHSHRLTETPDFSYLLNLEKLLLKDCPSLSAISETIGDLKNILLINFEKCTRLPNLPRSFYKLKSLDTLIISGCSMIDKLEEDVEQMESLKTLLADDTGIKQVPFSIVRSKRDGYISMCGYEGFYRDVFPSLIWSWMSPTNIVSFSSFVQSSFVGLALVSLDVPKFGSLCWVRSSSDHEQGLIRILNTLDATYFKVSNIRSSSLTEMGMKSQVTYILKEIILQKLTSNGPDHCLLPSDTYPASFSFNCEDSSIIFEVPHMNGCNLKAMFRIVYSSSPDTIISECLKTVSIKNDTKPTIQVYELDTLASFEDEEWQSLLSNLDPGNWVEVSRHRLVVKKTTVYPISDATNDQNMEQQEVALVSCGTDSGGDENGKRTSSKRKTKMKEFVEMETKEREEEEAVQVKDLEKGKSKRKPTSTTNSGVPPRAAKSQKTTSMIFDATTEDLMSPERSQISKVSTLIQESSHGDQVLQEKTHATDQLPYIEDLNLVSTTDGALIENSTLTPFVVGEETPREPNVVGNSIISTLPNLLFNKPVVESNMGRIEDALAQTLKETDNNDDIFAELDKVLGGEPSPTKASPAGSKAASIDINPAVKVLHECCEIIEGKDLRSLGTNEDLMCKLIDKLTELAPIRSHLPPVFKEMATKLERLHKDVLDHFIPTSQVLDQHRSLLDSNSKVLEDLHSLKKRKLDLDASTAEINMGLDDVARKRAKLEEELKLLVERENQFSSAAARPGKSPSVECRLYDLVDADEADEEEGGDSSNSLALAAHHKLEYDVFLSFRGKDTHATFSSLLHTSLEKAGISVFKDVDDDAHRRGEQMSIQQLKAIRKSRFCVIVFSRNYAGSKWCLLELENIIDCHKTKRQVVVPVFYDVDPEDIRNETGMIWEAFQDLVNRISAKEDKVQSWRDALREASSILGFVVKDYSRNRGEDIKKVAECVTRWVNRTNLPVATHPVGVQDGVQFLVKQLNKQKSDDVLLLGIWGMGGIGKTTFAKALYNQICCGFEGSSFLPNIRKAWQKEMHASLQERILSDIFLTRERRIPDIKSGKRRLEQRLHDKKVLLLLDDVNKREQLDALCGSREWFGPGSIIIITTRDKRLLIDHNHRVDLVHTMNEMDESESTELFSWHAFNQASPRQDFAELCGKVVSYCGGLPLALVVLGSELYRKEMIEWNSVLDGLREAPHRDVQNVLRISFDDLNDDKERDLFLDISFFYSGINKEDVIHALKGYGDSVKDGITVLEDRSLVKVDENGKFGMHVLLRGMGRKIMRDLFRIEPGPMIYDVFLSFRADTRASFTSHLYTYLQNAGCHVFKDDESLQKGDQISISMMQAIGRSRISIVVLSEKYPNSRWCMVELEQILECRRTTNQEVLPVFYGVRPSEVLHSGVRSKKRSMFRKTFEELLGNILSKKKSMFGEAFEELLGSISEDKDRELGWKRALADISAIQGDVIANSWNESKDIKKVVADVTKMLNKKYLFVAEHPVGVESRVADVIQLLDNHQEKDILVLGIWGMGGAGKTTIAKATYNEIGHKFEGRSFLLDVRKVWKEINGQVSLQKKLLSDVYEEMEIKIDNIEEGKNVLQERLRQKKILLVLDDVNDQEQLNALCASSSWFRKGSRIIITTRDKKLVDGVRKGEEELQARMRDVGFEIYPLKKMEERESIELFRWHAFQQAIPIERFHELSGKIVSYSGGLPLALEVLGKHLFGRDLEVWTQVSESLERIPDDKMLEKLRISFDGLSNDEEKNIFLDIAFFFIGLDRNDVIRILDGCGFSATTYGINVLEEQSLVTVDRDNKLGMHNLLRDMGREIVRREFPGKLEKRSRLWNSNDVLDVLQNKVRKGTGNIEGLALKLSKIKKIKLSAFEMMDKLRLLQLDGVELDGNFENMLRDLRWLCWRRFPSSYTPTEFDQGKLVAIELKYSNLKLMWEETQMLDKLKMLNLSHSHHLKKTPDFSYLPNLEKLSLEDCSELFYVSSTIGRLKKLKIINLKDCKKLLELPRRIYKLTSLQTLILSGCEKINKLEEHLEQMKSLTTLEADGTGIGQMPCALIRSKCIGKISWRDWKGISRDVFPFMIIWSWTSPTNNVSSRIRRSACLWSCIVSLIVPNSSFQGLSSTVSELPKLRRLKCSLQLPITGDVALDNLNASNLNEVEAMTPTPQVSNKNASLNFLLIQMGMDSPVTKILRQSMFQQKARTNWPGECLLPDDESPDWLTFNGEGDSVTFEVPQVNGRKLKSMILCIAYSSSTAIAASEGLNLERVSIRTKKTTLEYEGDILTSLKDEDWQSVVSNLQANNQVWVIVIFGHGILVKKTMIYLIYDEPNDQNMDHRPADVIASGGENIVSDGGDVATDMNENASSVDDMVAYKNVSISGGNMVANMNENVSGVVGIEEDENVSVTIVDDDMAEDKNATVSSSDDENDSKVDNMAVNKIVRASVSRPTSDFKDAEATPANQIGKSLDGEDTSFKRKRTVSSSSQRVVKPVPETQKVEATLTTKTFKPKYKGLTPFDQGLQTKPSCLVDIFKHEVTRVVYKEMMDMLKRLDNSLLASKYLINLFMAEKRTCKGKGLPKEADDAGEDSLTRGIHSQPSTGPSPRSVLLRRLYAYCTSSPSNTQVKEELLVNIHGHFLTRVDTASLCPSGWINNVVVSFAAMVINEDERACGSTARWCLKSYFTEEIAGEVNHCIDPRKSPLKRLSGWFDVPVGVEYEMIFAPVILQNHWWCYAFHRKDMRLYILDSLHSEHDAIRASLDRRVAIRILQNLQLHDPTFPPGLDALPLKHLKLPKQGNDDDCGVFTMKYMELWDPMRTYDGDLPMPNWTEADILNIRQQLLLKWVLDDRNELREKVLKDSELSSLCTVEPSIRWSRAHDSDKFPRQNSSNVEGEFFNPGASTGIGASGGEPGHYSDDKLVSTLGDIVRQVVEVLVAMPADHAAAERMSMVATPTEGVSVAVEGLVSSIRARQKTHGRKRGKGPQTLTPYTTLAYKRKRK